ncbi:MAG: sodium:alanine symporter family protein [Clostridiales bacterium]|nr:sodium:alanine symporter family protein [Clostridiales bacterium]
MANLLEVVKTINSYTADYVLIVLLIGTGIFFTIKTRFVQIRCFGEGMRNVFGKFSLKGGDHGGSMSSFQALASAVAAQVGTGNIVGACGAILTGGPGAIFWMWIIAFFGMATNYAEAVLAQKTREEDADGNVAGGPVYYIKKAFNNGFGKFLAGFFAVAIVLALGFMGCMVQSNSISESMQTALNIPGWVVGLVVAAVSAVVFIGGVKRLAAVNEKLVPIMALLYLVGGIVILICRIQYVPETIGMIFKYAFMPQAIIGGGIGSALKTALSQGAKRGLFSNEAGMGSTPHAHALAKVEKPHDQGVVAMIGVFIDTFVVLTMTALIVISTLYAGNGPLMEGAAEGISKSNMVQLAFSNVFATFMGNDLGAKVGAIFVAICLLFFAFSTILSWNLFGKINFQYLFGKKAVIVYSVIAIVFIFLGSLLSNDLVWELTDMFNYLMVIPNAIALLALNKLVKDEAIEGERLNKLSKKNK